MDRCDPRSSFVTEHHQHSTSLPPSCHPSLPVFRAQSTLFTLDVAPAGAGTNDTVTAVPTSEFADLPDYLTDLLDDADVIVGSEDGVETIDLGGGGNRGVNGDPFPGFGAEEYVAQFCVGNKYEMELGGGGNGASKHPYHHHINHFQV